MSIKNTFNIITPCHFGMEAVLKREIIDLGYEITAVDDGRVTFRGDADAIVRANIFLRTAERVLMECASFSALTFDELFEGTKAIAWEDILPENAKFWVAKASSVRSKLFSPSDIQSIVKKAIVDRLSKVYGITWFQEDGESYPMRVFIKKDVVTICLDTTGESLHKRGYRKQAAKAPIAENLAAGLILLSKWNNNKSLADPFCGSGTFPIEAAMIAAHIAPGMNRSFTAENWSNIIPRKLWYECVDEAADLVDISVETDIQGYDIESDMIRASIENAKLAGVNDLIYFRRREVKDFVHDGQNGLILTNPPYGERLLEKELLPKLYGELGAAVSKLQGWEAGIITSYSDVEKYIGYPAYKNRKIYNGMLKTYFYQFKAAKVSDKVELKPERELKKKAPEVRGDREAKLNTGKRQPKKWTMK